jgi:hypothetical protein
MERDHPVPEADAQEQETPVEAVRTRIQPTSGDEVPEADALEQSVVEPLDEDEGR